MKMASMVMAAVLVVCVAAPAFALSVTGANFEARGYGHEVGIGMVYGNVNMNAGASVNDHNDSGGSQANYPSGIMHGRGLKIGIVNRINRERQDYMVNMQARRQARDDFAKARSDEKENMGEFMAARERLRHAASDSERAEATEQVRVKARETLLAQVNAVLAYIQASADTNTNADLNAFFSAEKARLEDANISRQQLVKVSQEIRQYWRQHQEEVREGSLIALNARIAAINAKAQDFYNRISRQIQSLQAAGVDVNLLAEAQAKLGSDINALRDASAKINAQYAAGQLDTRGMNSISALLRAMAFQLQKDLGLVKSLFRAVIQLRQGGSVDAHTSEELRENSQASVTESVMANAKAGLDANADGGDDQ